MKAAWGLSWAYAACIFVISIIGATSPIALRNSQNENRDRFLNLGSLFGAGVFLSAGFVHLLGDAAAELDDGYPWAMTVSSSALILTMLIEKVVLSLLQQAGQEVVVEETMTPALTIEKNENDREVEEQEEAPPIELPYKFDLRGDPLTAFVMFSALSFHSFLGGLGLGADPENSTAIFIAIMAHKGFAAFAFGPCHRGVDGFIFASHSNRCVRWFGDAGSRRLEGDCCGDCRGLRDVHLRRSGGSGHTGVGQTRKPPGEGRLCRLGVLSYGRFGYLGLKRIRNGAKIH